MGTTSRDLLDFERYFQPIQERFLQEAKPNEPVLVVAKHYDFKGCTGFGYEPKPRDYTLDTDFYFGVLPAEEPLSTVDGQQFTILVPRHVRWWGYDYHVEDKPIAIGPFATMMANLAEPIYSRDYSWAQLQKEQEQVSHKKPDYPLEVIVGSEAIQRYCAERGPTYTEFYLKAASLLGVLPPGLAPAIAERYSEKRESILKQLETLGEQERREQQEIDRIFGSVKEGVYYTGRGITVCETEDDARVISIGPRRRRDEARAGMRHTLKEALSLGLHTTPWVKTYPDKPGTSLDVPRYIRGLCKRLKVPLT